MNTAKYKSRLKQAIEDLVGFKMIALGQTMAIIMLGYFVLTADTSEKTIVTPPNYTKPFWVKGGEFSPDYVEQMSRHFINYLLTYQRSSANAQFEEVLRFADPTYYPALKTQLSNDMDRINRNELGSVFYLTGIDIRKNDAYVDGDLVGSIGQQWLPKKHKTYRLSYNARNGNFYITGFKEVWKQATGEYIDVEQREDEMVELPPGYPPVAQDINPTASNGGNI